MTAYGEYNFAPRAGAVWGISNTPGREVLLRSGAGVLFGTANRLASEAFNALGFSSNNHLVEVPVPVTSAQLDFSTNVASS